MRTSSPIRGLVGLLLVFGLVAAACGNDDDDPVAGDTTTTEDGGTDTTDGDDTTTTEGDGGEAPDDIDPDGTLRLASSLDDGAASTAYDLNTMPSPATELHMLIYDTLMRCQMDGSFEPGLAESFEVVDANTLTVTLHEDVQFSDGTPMDAQAVADSILSHRDAENQGAFAGELNSIESIDVDSETELTINLSDPIAGVFTVYLCRGETMPFSQAEGIDHNENPTGAGPYLLESLSLQDSLVLTKNPNYFEADSIRIPTVEVVHVDSQDPQAVVNALRSDAVDTAATITKAQADSLEGTGLEIEISASPNGLYWGQMCKNREPLDNLQVRQALNHAIDRDRINDVVTGGLSEAQWGFWPSDHPFHDPELDDFYAYDLDKARELLADSGLENIEVTLAVTPGDSQTITEIIQQDWEAIGVSVTIEQPGANLLQEFFNDNKQDGYFFQLQRSGLDKVTRNLSTESIGNICQWQDPDLNAKIAEIQALPQGTDSPETVQAWMELDRIVLEGAMNMFGIFGLETRVWNPDRLGDVDFVPNFQGNPRLDVMDAYVKG